ncbi:hypothetical protein OCEANICA350_11023 [Oceanicaulis sp. 350]|nr:hypothetical protein OCEANICA350_11023 [Oceanicaulis sp. 350]
MSAHRGDYDFNLASHLFKFG